MLALDELPLPNAPLVIILTGFLRGSGEACLRGKKGGRKGLDILLEGRVRSGVLSFEGFKGWECGGSLREGSQ